MKLFIHIIFISLALLLMQNCSPAVKEDATQIAPSKKVSIKKKLPKNKMPPVYERKFSDDWKQRFPSNLTPSQDAYCLTQYNKGAFTAFKDWIFIVNSHPKRFNSHKIIGIETHCRVFTATFGEQIPIENLSVGEIIIADGQIDKDGSIKLWKFLKIN